MGKEKYLDLFRAFEKAPMEESMRMIMDEVSTEAWKKLVLDDVTCHRYHAGIVTLEAWMTVVPIESNRQIRVQMEQDASSGSIRTYYFTKDSYRKESLLSLQACIDYYNGKNQYQPAFSREFEFQGSRTSIPFAVDWAGVGCSRSELWKGDGERQYLLEWPGRGVAVRDPKMRGRGLPKTL